MHLVSCINEMNASSHDNFIECNYATFKRTLVPFLYDSIAAIATESTYSPSSPEGLGASPFATPCR